MDDMIEVLTIAKKYASSYGLKYPFNAAHDELYLNIQAEDVSEEDLKRLEELSFVPDEFGGLTSTRFGSC